MKVREASWLLTSEARPVRVKLEPVAEPAVSVPWSVVRVTETVLF